MQIRLLERDRGPAPTMSVGNRKTGVNQLPGWVRTKEWGELEGCPGDDLPCSSPILPHPLASEQVRSRNRRHVLLLQKPI
jgi:hypothetical protein